MFKNFDKIQTLLRQKFGLNLAIFPADHWQHAHVRTEIVCLPENQISFSQMLNCFIYSFRLATGTRFVATIEGEVETIQNEKNDIHLLMELSLNDYLQPLTRNAMLINKENELKIEHLNRQLEVQKLKNQNNHSDDLTAELTTAHLGLVGSEFENFKFALEAHEKSKRWAFLRIENEKDLEMLEGSDIKLEGTTFFINMKLEDKLKTHKSFLVALSKSPDDTGIWLILSSKDTFAYTGFNSEHLYIHYRKGLEIVSKSKSTLH